MAKPGKPKKAGPAARPAPAPAFSPQAQELRALLPGIFAQPGHLFAGEQELHGLRRVGPWAIHKIYKADDLTHGDI